MYCKSTLLLYLEITSQFCVLFYSKSLEFPGHLLLSPRAFLGYITLHQLTHRMNTSPLISPNPMFAEPLVCHKVLVNDCWYLE